MKVHIVLTTRDGQIFEGDASLSPMDGGSSKTVRTPRPAQSARGTKSEQPQAIDFALPTRAFAKRYGRSLTGAQKFTALVAKLAAGKTGVAVNVKDVERHWSQMTGLLGKYNGAHSSRAKDNGWVDSPKSGFYVLVSGWEAGLSGK
jgi:hypothetical protein